MSLTRMPVSQNCAAHHNVQINLITQNFVENPVYFPPEFTETEAFQQLLQQVPIGRLGSG